MNVLISAANPWVPVANPTDHPRYIRKGEIIGTLTDPASFFDTPKSAEEWAPMAVGLCQPNCKNALTLFL